MNTEQFPPGVYDILNGINNTRIARVLSLSTTLPTAPGVNWQPNMEHWFTTASLTNLQTAFSISAIKAKYAANLTNLNVIATELADPTKYKFQLYAKGVLTVQDWISGVPAYNTPAYYFVQNSPPVPTRAMRPPLRGPEQRSQQAGERDLDDPRQHGDELLRQRGRGHHRDFGQQRALSHPRERLVLPGSLTSHPWVFSRYSLSSSACARSRDYRLRTRRRPTAVNLSSARPAKREAQRAREATELHDPPRTARSAGSSALHSTRWSKPSTTLGPSGVHGPAHQLRALPTTSRTP
jgi:hypothetical protein